MVSTEQCPCGSGRSFDQCCGPYLDGSAVAPTAEALMRSRYSAYVRRDVGYLLASWHVGTRPAKLNFGPDSPVYHKLEVAATEAGAEGDDQGWVEFGAHFSSPKGDGVLCERSRFLKEEGSWYYVVGEKIGRNAPCPCGSGKKYKRCCGQG